MCVLQCAQVTVEEVEKLMEDSAEAQAQQDRMHDALSASLTPEQDKSARAELAALEAKAEQEEVGSTLIRATSLSAHQHLRIG